MSLINAKKILKILFQKQNFDNLIFNNKKFKYKKILINN